MSLFKTFRMNLEKLSKPELLTLFSILEGELEARDLVIEALKVCGESLVSCVAACVSSVFKWILA